MRLGLIPYKILYGVCRLVGHLPNRLLYGPLAAAICCVLHRVIRYRLAIVRDNLAGAFPELSEAERRDIERRFYRHLSEVFVDTIKLASISREEILARMSYPGIEAHEERMRGRSWICAMAHYGSWELTINYVCHSDHRLLAVYHKLHSPTFDRYYRWVRSRFGTQPVPMREVYREVIKSNRPGNQPAALALIADQSPKIYDIEQWYRFFDRPTAFYGGVERLALRFGMPVAFLHITQTSPGCYEGRMEMIYDGVETVDEGEITRRYIERLEAQIREAPHLWMWSHRRWKHTPDKVARWKEQQRQRTHRNT